MFKSWLTLNEASTVGNIINSIFPDTNIAYDNDEGTEATIEFPDRRLKIDYKASWGEAYISFTKKTGDPYGQSRELQAGSVSFVRNLKRLATALGQQGIKIAYTTLNDTDGERRANAYGKFFNKGWEREEGGWALKQGQVASAT